MSNETNEALLSYGFVSRRWILWCPLKWIPAQVSHTKEAFITSPSWREGKGQDKWRYYFSPPVFSTKAGCAPNANFRLLFLWSLEKYLSFEMVTQSLKIGKNWSWSSKAAWGRTGQEEEVDWIGFGGFGKTGLYFLNSCPISWCIRMIKHMWRKEQFPLQHQELTLLSYNRCK